MTSNISVTSLKGPLGSHYPVNKMKGMKHRKMNIGRMGRVMERRMTRNTTAYSLMEEVEETKVQQVKKSTEVQDMEKDYLLGTYQAARPSGIAFTRGEGCTLYDAEGRSYMDFTAGIAVNVLGHSDPQWAAAISSQAQKLCHVSNLYSTSPAALLAKELCEEASPWAKKAFFANSGTEANEAAIKFARKYQGMKYDNFEYPLGRYPWDKAPYEFVAFTDGFHGRTMGSLALTWKKKYRTPFEPVMPGVRFAQFNDIDSANRAIQRGRTCAVFIEPMQGEGGINPALPEFLRAVRNFCNEAGALLVFDEVQCGLGRTGKMFAHQWYNVMPDMMTLAKPLAAGLPIGSVLMTDEVAMAMATGDHGSTFAGGPLVCSSGLHVMTRLKEAGFMEDVVAKGELLVKRLKEEIGEQAIVKEVRGKGLLVGIEMRDCSAGKIVDLALSEGLLVLTAGEGNVVRLVPALIVTKEEIEDCVKILKKCFKKLES